MNQLLIKSGSIVVGCANWLYDTAKRQIWQSFA